jgi:2-polyprenyl-6-methoxyphenol hydroxylase-like FAD-dependent oxidoreductase
MAGLTDGLQRLFALPGAAPKELRNRGLTLLDRLAPLKRVLAGQAFGD